MMCQVICNINETIIKLGTYFCHCFPLKIQWMCQEKNVHFGTQQLFMSFTASLEDAIYDFLKLIKYTHCLNTSSDRCIALQNFNLFLENFHLFLQNFHLTSGHLKTDSSTNKSTKNTVQKADLSTKNSTTSSKRQIGLPDRNDL